MKPTAARSELSSSGSGTSPQPYIGKVSFSDSRFRVKSALPCPIAGLDLDRLGTRVSGFVKKVYVENPKLGIEFPTFIGYAQVSTKDQDLSLQTDALTKAACERIFTDHGVSGAALTKPGLTQALDFARAGDTLERWPGLSGQGLPLVKWFLCRLCFAVLGSSRREGVA